MIDIELAYRLRFKRGLKLPINTHYTIDRLREIANEQDDLFNRLNELDNEIVLMFEDSL